jgi:hypothetical protein
MSPLTRFSVIPYLLEPYDHNITPWHRNHQQAHTDFQSALAGYLGGTAFGGSPPPFSQLGPGYNIEDYDLSTESQANWWTFQNHIAHLDAESVVSLIEELIFPFL